MACWPNGWSVVLVGMWNPAILSPIGIKNYIFKLDQNTQVQVAVPLDGISANLVTDPTRSLTVYVFKEKLQIDIPKQTFESLNEAMGLGINAIEALPKTPIVAVGFNLNFATDAIIPELVDLTSCKLDDKIIFQKFNISGRTTIRNIQFKDGLVSLSIIKQPESFNINCNFHLSTQDFNSAINWLKTPIEDIKDTIAKIGNVLNLELKEKNNDDIVL